MLKFFYNGIKSTENGSKLEKAFFYTGSSALTGDMTITITARDYKRFSAEIRNAFTVENNTDSQTDYFEKDRIRVRADHPLYAEVKAAHDAAAAKWEKRQAQAEARRRAQRQQYVAV